jgi:predicted RNA-binding protein YlqC (UPF0109 family)
MTDIETTFRLLACEFCRFPKDLRIKVSETGHSIIVSYSAHADDVRKLVGKRGSMFAALELVLRAVAARIRKRAKLIVDEPHTGQPQPAAAFVADPTWMETKARKLMQELSKLLFDGETEIKFNELSSDLSTMILEIGENETWIESDGHEILDTELSEALSRIFDSIGRAQGRKLYVELERTHAHNTESLAHRR